MTNRVIGPGVSLPPPQILYPAVLANDPYTMGGNKVSLAAGESIQVPAGDWFIDLGKYSILEVQDPVGIAAISQTSGSWMPIRTQRGSFVLRTDGVNYRISNLTGCVVGAIVTQKGKSYVQASTTITPSTGNSTWQPVVGGAIQSISLTGLGANYGQAPVVYIPAPPAPGIQATAIATISAGALTGITVVNQGAGYTTVPAITILPNPFDLNTPTTAATAAAALSSPTILTGAILTNSGAPVATTMTLTVAGGNSSGTLTPVFLTTVSALSLTAFGSGAYTQAALSTIGGSGPSGNAFTYSTEFIPRPLQAIVSLSAGVAGGPPTIIDGGMFLSSPTPLVGYYGGGPASSAAGNAITVQITQGSATDTVTIQPL